MNLLKVGQLLAESIDEGFGLIKMLSDGKLTKEEIKALCKDIPSSYTQKNNTTNIKKNNYTSYIIKSSTNPFTNSKKILFNNKFVYVQQQIFLTSQIKSLNVI